jgi:DNA-binding NarL/FixJ family response regulator
MVGATEITRKLLPDAIIIDPEMPSFRGIEAIRTIHAELPHIKVIGLLINDEIDVRDEMLQAGAIRYLFQEPVLE